MPLIVNTYANECAYSQTDYPQRYRDAFHVYPDFWPENTPGFNNCCESEISFGSTDDLAAVITEETVVFHCFSPEIAAFAALLLEQNRQVVILLPGMDKALIEAVFMDWDALPLSVCGRITRPLTITAFSSRDDFSSMLEEQPDLAVFSPIRPTEPICETLSLADLRTYWMDVSHDEAAWRASFTLEALLGEEFSPDHCREILESFPLRQEEIQSAEEGTPLALLKLAAPYAAEDAPAQAEAFLTGLDDYLLTREYTDEEKIPSFFACLAENYPAGMLTMLSDEQLTCVPPVSADSSFPERAYQNCLRLQGDFLLHLIERCPSLSLGYVCCLNGCRQHLFAPLEAAADIRTASSEYDLPAEKTAAEPPVPTPRLRLSLPDLPWSRTEGMAFLLCPFRCALEFSLSEGTVFSTRADCVRLSEALLIDFCWQELAGQPAESEHIRDMLEKQRDLLRKYLPFAIPLHNAEEYITGYLAENGLIRPYAPSHAEMKLRFGQATHTSESVSGEPSHPYPAFDALTTGSQYRRQYPLHSLPKTADHRLTAAMQEGLDGQPEKMSGPWCQSCPHVSLCLQEECP